MKKTTAAVTGFFINLFKKINGYFINAVLFIFYFIGIGFGWVIYGFIRKNRHKKSSFWIESIPQIDDIKTFRSPY